MGIPDISALSPPPSQSGKREYSLALAGFGSSILVFLITLFVPIPPEIGRFLKYGTAATAILLILVFWFLLTKVKRIFSVLVIVAVFLLFAITLSWQWQSDSADWGTIGGLLPVSDAAIYTMDAVRLNQGAAFSITSSYRPIANGFLSVLLKVSGGDIRIVLAVLALLVASSIYSLVNEVKNARGALVASVTLVVMFFFIRIYIGKLLTESFGITFGALAFTFLISGARKNSQPQVIFGIGVLTMAMNIRAGAYFTIFALLLWASRLFRGKRLVSPRLIAVGLAVIVLTLGINSVVLRAIGAKNVAPFANFADSAYGVASGYKGWRYVYQIHPGASAAEKYQHTIELIRNNPQSLLQGISRAYLDFFNPGSYNIFSFLNFHVKEGENLYLGVAGKEKFFVYIPVFLLAGLGLYSCFKQKGYWRGLVLYGWLGILASVPFVPPVDAGIRPYAVTIPLVGFLLGEGCHWIAGMVKIKINFSPSKLKTPACPVILIGILLPLVIIGPILVKYSSSPLSSPVPIICPASEDYIFLQIVKGARIDIISDIPVGFIQRPSIPVSLYRDNILRQRLPSDIVAQLSSLSNGKSILYAINLGGLEQDFLPIFLIVDTYTLDDGVTRIQGCGKNFGDTSMGHFYVLSIFHPVGE